MIRRLSENQGAYKTIQIRTNGQAETGRSDRNAIVFLTTKITVFVQIHGKELKAIFLKLLEAAKRKTCKGLLQQAGQVKDSDLNFSQRKLKIYHQVEHALSQQYASEVDPEIQIKKITLEIYM